MNSSCSFLEEPILQCLVYILTRRNKQVWVEPEAGMEMWMVTWNTYAALDGAKGRVAVTFPLL